MKQYLFLQSMELIKSVAIIIDFVEYDATFCLKSIFHCFVNYYQLC